MTKGKCFVLRHSVAWVAAMLLFTGCKNDYDFVGSGTETTEDAKDAVVFSTVVSSSRQASRADNTIINKGETMLLPTATTKKKVGLFGCYTGQYKWSELWTLSQKASPTDAEKKLLDDHYTANHMYNVPATIKSDGSLSYTPLAFWPNNVLASDATQHEYMTFWAYYPYNETSALGEYGISMTDDEEGTGKGKGMGKVKFVMHSDAAQQNDFLISAPVTDCNRDKYMLQRTDNTPSYDPKPVQFRLYHMLAQVRFYTYIRGDDKMVYQKDISGNDLVADATWFDSWATEGTIMDAYGNVYTKKEDGTVERTTQKTSFPTEFAANLTKDEFLRLGLKVPDESKCVRWDRTDGVWDLNHARRRANIKYEFQFNNIHTTATFYPHYYYPQSDAVSIDVNPATTLGSATVNNYIMNPYWFTFLDGKRTRLNDNYMFGYYEDTPVYHKYDATDQTTLDAAVGAGTKYDDFDGKDWTGLTDPLGYLSTKSEAEKAVLAGLGDNSAKHYNYAPGNVLLVVPQTLNDEDVPHVIITAAGKTYTNGNSSVLSDGSAKVTVNMLKMGISWESGYIYCYAFLDDLKPGDDKVRGPESITVLFNKDWYTDQW